jgi:membrane protease YdiL (CAAX protease family)
MNKRLAIAMCLSVMPWPAVWFGMYKLNSIVWAFVLYHGVCLLPAIIWGRDLWTGHMKRPTSKQTVVLVSAALAFCLGGLALYHVSGNLIVDRNDVLHSLTDRGYEAQWLLPISIYLVVINAILEELFWRGVVLNELEPLNERMKHFGTLWAAMTFATWHWLVFHALLKPGWAELSVLVLVGIGVFCSWLYKRTGSIVMPILFHAFVLDLAVIVIFVTLSNG